MASLVDFTYGPRSPPLARVAYLRIPSGRLKRAAVLVLYAYADDGSHIRVAGVPIIAAGLEGVCTLVIHYDTPMRGDDVVLYLPAQWTPPPPHAAVTWKLIPSSSPIAGVFTDLAAMSRLAAGTALPPTPDRLGAVGFRVAFRNDVAERHEWAPVRLEIKLDLSEAELDYAIVQSDAMGDRVVGIGDHQQLLRLAVPPSRATLRDDTALDHLFAAGPPQQAQLIAELKRLAAELEAEPDEDAMDIDDESSAGYQRRRRRVAEQLPGADDEEGEGEDEGEDDGINPLQPLAIVEDAVLDRILPFSRAACPLTRSLLRVQVIDAGYPLERRADRPLAGNQPALTRTAYLSGDATVPLFMELFTSDVRERSGIVKFITDEVYGLADGDLWTLTGLVDAHLSSTAFAYFLCEALLYCIRMNEKTLAPLAQRIRATSVSALRPLVRGLVRTLRHHEKTIFAGERFPHALEVAMLGEEDARQVPTEVARLREAEAKIKVVEETRLAPAYRLKPYQRMASAWMLMRQQGFGFIGMEPGMGKTLSFVAYALAAAATKQPGITLVVTNKRLAQQWVHEITQNYTKNAAEPPPRILLVTNNVPRVVQELAAKKAVDPGVTFIITTPSFVFAPEARASADRVAIQQLFTGLARDNVIARIVVDEAHEILRKRSAKVLLPEATNAARFLMSGTLLLNLQIKDEIRRYYANGFSFPPNDFDARYAGDVRQDFFLADYGSLTLQLPEYTLIQQPFKLDAANEALVYYAMASSRAGSDTPFQTASYKFTLAPTMVDRRGTDFNDIRASVRTAMADPVIAQAGLFPLLTRAAFETVFAPDYVCARLRALRTVIAQRSAQKTYLPYKGRATRRHAFLLYSQRRTMREGGREADWSVFVRDRLGIAHDRFFVYTGKSEEINAWTAAALADDAPDEPVFLFLTYGKGGVGLNLQVADTIVLMDKTWVPAQHVQAIARGLRIGQTNKRLVVFELVCERTEEEVHRQGRLDLKTRVAIIATRSHAGAEAAVVAEEMEKEPLAALIRPLVDEFTGLHSHTTAYAARARELAATPALLQDVLDYLTNG